MEVVHCKRPVSMRSIAISKIVRLGRFRNKTGSTVHQW